MRESCEPMGLREDLHIADILKISRVREMFRFEFGRASTQDDIDDIDDIEVVGVHRSEVPVAPISPKKRLIVSVMFFISLIISIFIAYLVRVLREK